jgi:hypothetical protein
MDQIPIVIRDINLTHNPKSIAAKCAYRLPNGSIEVQWEMIKFDKIYPFNVLFDKVFEGGEIADWIDTHNHWDRTAFLLDKINEFVGTGNAAAPE